MVALRHHIIGGIEILPSENRAPDRDPRVRSVATREFAIRAHIPADVASRQAQRSQAGDHQVREILAHTALGLENFATGVDTVVARWSYLKSS